MKTGVAILGRPLDLRGYKKPPDPPLQYPGGQNGPIPGVLF